MSDRGDAAEDEPSVRFNITTSLTPTEVVYYLDESDEAVFAFVWAVIHDDRLGTELRERLLEQLAAEMEDEDEGPV